jgi:hypothetical protein
MYESEREFFLDFKRLLGVDAELVSEIEGALSEVHLRYDTKVWENRFIAGGVTEQVVGSAARRLGLEVANAGKQNQGFDLQLPGGEGISLKAVFGKPNSQIRLINALGSGTRVWVDATIFPIATIGIGYADPDLTPGLTSSSGDALVIKGRDLVDFWESNPRWLIDFVNVPPKASGGNTSVASDVIAFDLFQRFPGLMDGFKPEI